MTEQKLELKAIRDLLWNYARSPMDASEQVRYDAALRLNRLIDVKSADPVPASAVPQHEPAATKWTIFEHLDAAKKLAWEMSTALPSTGPVAHYGAIADHVDRVLERLYAGSAAPLRPQANTDGPSARLRRLATGECFFDGDELREIADCIDRLLPPAPPLEGEPNE